MRRIVSKRNQLERRDKYIHSSVCFQDLLIDVICQLSGDYDLGESLDAEFRI